MIDLPPDFDTDPIVEALVECGLAQEGVAVSYDKLLQDTVVIIREEANATADHFGCIRQAIGYAIPEFEASEMGAAYWQFVAEQERPRRLEESRQTLTSFGLLDDFPRREDYADLADYLRALERHAGLEEGLWLRAMGEQVHFQPPKTSAEENSGATYEDAARLLALVRHASLLGDMPTFGFVGNERVAKD